MEKSKLPLLILLVLGLSALVWFDYQSEETAPGKNVAETNAGEAVSALDEPSDAENPASTDTASANPLASLKIDTLRATVERPLFASSRQRPPPPPVRVSRPVFKSQPKPKPKPKPPSYILLGIVSGGERATALLRQKSDGRNIRVEVGDMIGGWHVAKVKAKSVLLERNDDSSQTVLLFKE